jgi:hypothetical protein
MRAKQLVIGLLSAGSMLSMATACAHQNEAAGEISPLSAVAVLVKNNNFLDVDVFAVADGVPTRLGMVTGNSKAMFAVDPSFATQNFSIIATPIGGSGRASTGNVLVSAGQTVEFTVGSTLSNSSVYVR